MRTREANAHQKEADAHQRGADAHQRENDAYQSAADIYQRDDNMCCRDQGIISGDMSKNRGYPGSPQPYGSSNNSIIFNTMFFASINYMPSYHCGTIFYATELSQHTLCTNSLCY